MSCNNSALFFFLNYFPFEINIFLSELRQKILPVSSKQNGHDFYETIDSKKP